MSLEDALCPLPLRYSPWISGKNLPLDLKHHPLIHTSLSVLHKATRNTGLSGSVGPLTPIQDNPDFPPGVGNRFLQSPDPGHILLAKHCFQGTQIKNFQTLKTDVPLPDLTLWNYRQIRSFVNTSHNRNH